MDGTTVTALARDGLVLRDLLTINGWESDGDPKTWCYFSGESNISVSVETQTGSTESRNFVGGVALEVPAIIDRLGLDAPALSITLSHLHTTVEDMARGGRLRLAEVEVHRAVFNNETYGFVSAPYLQFVGFIHEAQIENAPEGGAGQLTLDCRLNSGILTKSNPAMKSHDRQLLRSGDRARLYADVAGSVGYFWGMERS